MNNSDRIIQKLHHLLEKNETVIVAIDGNCTAGKTTLANEISMHFDCNVFHMDDFFLRPHQRVPERFEEPGGNVDYERFRAEVLLPLLSGCGFSYRPYICKEQRLGTPVSVVPKALNIVEGTYSLHPSLEEAYTYKIFIGISPELQKTRIFQRSPGLHKRFFEEWIPLEEKYFNETKAKERCDTVLFAAQ